MYRLGKGDHSLVNTAFNQGSIPDNVISLAFVPRSRENETGSVVTLGGVDSQHHTGAITHVYVHEFSSNSTVAEHLHNANRPLTLVEGLGLNGFSHSLTYANTRLLGSGLLSSLTGVIDTRSTLTLLSTGTYNPSSPHHMG